MQMFARIQSERKLILFSMRKQNPKKKERIVNNSFEIIQISPNLWMAFGIMRCDSIEIFMWYVSSIRRQIFIGTCNIQYTTYIHTRTKKIPFRWNNWANDELGTKNILFSDHHKSHSKNYVVSYFFYWMYWYVSNDQTPTSLLYYWIVGYCHHVYSSRCASMCFKSNKKLFNAKPSHTRITWMPSFKFELNSSVCFRLCVCVHECVALHEWHASISFGYELRHLRALHSTHAKKSVHPCRFPFNGGSSGWNTQLSTESEAMLLTWLLRRPNV